MNRYAGHRRSDLSVTPQIVCGARWWANGMAVQVILDMPLALPCLGAHGGWHQATNEQLWMRNEGRFFRVVATSVSGILAVGRRDDSREFMANSRPTKV
jgi:hypothetical protein